MEREQIQTNLDSSFVNSSVPPNITLVHTLSGINITENEMKSHVRSIAREMKSSIK